MQLPCHIEELVPHTPPMLLVKTLLERSRGDGNDHARIEAVVPVEGPFLAAGGVLPEYYIELGAQAMAAVNGYDRHMAGRKRGGGFLVGVDDFRIFTRVGAGTILQVTLEKEFAFHGVRIFNTTVHMGESTVAAGRIRIWQEPVP